MTNDDILEFIKVNHGEVKSLQAEEPVELDWKECDNFELTNVNGLVFFKRIGKVAQGVITKKFAEKGIAKLRTFFRKELQDSNYVRFGCYTYEDEHMIMFFSPNSYGVYCGEWDDEFLGFNFKAGKGQWLLNLKQEDFLDLIENCFNESVRYELDDPIINNGDLSGEELTFVCGGEEELRGLVEQIIGTDPDVFKKDPQAQISISSGYEGYDAKINWDWGCSENLLTEGEPLPRLEKLLNLALDENTPTGYEMTYNDGAYNRRSGYSEDPLGLIFNVTQPEKNKIDGMERALYNWAKNKLSKSELKLCFSIARQSELDKPVEEVIGGVICEVKLK